MISSSANSEKLKTKELKAIVEKYEMQIMQIEQSQEIRVNQLMMQREAEYSQELSLLKSQLLHAQLEINGFRQENRELREVYTSFTSKIDNFKKNCKCEHKKLLE